MLEEIINRMSVNMTMVTSAIVIFLLVLSVIIKNESELVKRLLFWPMAISIAGTTLTLVALTIYLNISSYTKGPVHWHAGIEFYGCGEYIDLKNPVGRFSNKVGSPTFHEHNDQWMHLEGVPITPHDASLGKFLGLVGVELTGSSLKIPSNGRVADFANGDRCGDIEGIVQVFIYKFEKAGDKYLYRQSRLTDMTVASEYVMSHTPNMPPGDCIIVEFDRRKDKTDNLCKVYKAALARGDIAEK